MKALWRGSALNMMKYNYGWVSFLSMHNGMMKSLDRYGYDVSAGSKASIGCDASIAIINSPFMTALDVMYNKVTSDRPIPTARPFEVMKYIYRQEGLKSFFRGTPQGFGLSLFAVIGRGWTIQRIEQLDKERALLHKTM